MEEIEGKREEKYTGLLLGCGGYQQTSELSSSLLPSISSLIQENFMKNQPNSLCRRVFAFWLLALFALTRPAQALTPLPPNGGSVTGTLDANHAYIQFSYTLPRDEDATFTLTTSAGLRASIIFNDAGNSNTITQSGVVGFGSSGTLGIGHLAPGATYVVQAQIYDGSGTFTLSSAVTAPAAVNDAEPNNDPKHATALVPNSFTTGHLGYSRSFYKSVDTGDWYSFKAPQDGDVTFTLTTDSVFPLRASIVFYEEDGNTRITNSGVAGAGSSTQLGIAHLSPGATYYVVAQIYDGYGGYTLTNAEASPTIANDALPNQDPLHARVLPVNGAVAGHLGYSLASYNLVNTGDYYSFTAPKDGDVTFTLATDSVFPLRAKIQFFDSDGSTYITQSGVAGVNGSVQLGIAHLSPGATYYVVAQIYDGYGGYTFTNAFTPVTVANDKGGLTTPQTATALPVNTTTTGHLGFSMASYNSLNTYDYYAITVPQNGDVTLTLKTDSVFPLRARINFYDSDGSTYISQSGVAGVNGSVQLGIPHLSPGATYYAIVALYDGYGGYTLTDAFTPVGVGNSPATGMAPGTAAAFPVNTSVTGNLGYSLNPYNDINTAAYYSFVAPRDSDVTFTLATDPFLPLRAQLYFFDADGNNLVANTGVVSSGSSGAFTIGHLAPGATYYVAVGRYDGYGGFTLSNTVAPLFVANDAEINDTYSQAAPLNNLSNVTGHLGYSRVSYDDQDEIDWYQIALPAGNFQANIALSGSLRSYFYLFAPDGNTQLTNIGVIQNGGTGTLSYNIPTAGVYYLAVSRYDGYGAYDINQPLTATVYGTVTLESIAQFAPAQTVSVEFRTPGTTTALFTRQISVGYNGAYFLSNVPRGKYTLAFKGAKWLRKDITGVDVTVGDANGVNAFLPAGDSNNDNSIDSTDFGTLIGAFGGDASIPNSGYDITADFNCDGTVDSTDFGLLIGNFNAMGDK